MKDYRKITALFLIVCISLISRLYGQDSLRVSVSFQNESFSNFVRTIESSTPLRFFYNPKQTDSIKVKLTAQEISVNDLLSRVFANTNLNFAINSNRVFIFDKKYTVQTTLPEGIFKFNKTVVDTVDRSVTAATVQGNTQLLKSSIENKLITIGTPGDTKGNAKIAGYVRDGKNGEAIIGASVYIDQSSNGVVSDQFGYYSLTLSKGRHTIRISSLGMKETRRTILLHSDGKLDIELQDDVPTLKSVVIVSERNSNVRRMEMGVERLNIKTIKQMPVLLGEADILRAVLTLPGVTSVGEASTGFNVRGGSADQNLVLFDDATVYNPSHFFGFFSSFNADVVKGVELYKSSIPEKYGGRLSSVLDVETKDGNTKKLSGTAGIGLLTSKLTLEGPLIKDKTSFVVSGRTTYSNWLLRNLRNSQYGDAKASFYDVNAHLSHSFNAKNQLFLTAYTSNDKFQLNDDTTYKYGNRNVVMKWKHIFNNKMYMVLLGGLDQYHYTIEGDEGTEKGFQMDFKISQANFKADFTYTPQNNHNFEFGVQTIRYKIYPGTYNPSGVSSIVSPDIVSPEQGLESAVYFGDRFAITSNLSLNLGMRYSMFNYLGPKQVYSYVKGLPRETTTIADSVQYGKGDNIQTYHGPEFRIALRLSLSENASIKASFNSLRQYIHLLSNTTAISPTDIWKLSDPHIQPQLGEQASLGYYQNFKSNTIETSIEVYYKRLRNFLDYKSGASLVLNHSIETDVINTNGKSYGLELMLKKNNGKLNGWISYTYSRTLLKMSDSIAGQVINNGNYYPANFDKPHNLNVIANYRFTHRYSVSLNTVYTTGRPITLPIAIFYLAGAQRVYYSERNQYRIPDYFRVDLSFQLEGNHNIKQKTHNSWTVGVYNMLARKNPYSIYFTEENGVIKGYKLSVIGTAIPYVTFNIRF